MKVHNPNKLPVIPIADLLPTQGELKDLTEANYKKLKGVIENRGFSVPVYVWTDKQGIKHLLDGHGRRRVLTTEGWNEPIPYLTIPAKDMQEAMARLLEITSQYQEINQEGIDQFIATYELSEQEVYEATSFDATPFFSNADKVNAGDENSEWADIDDFDIAEKSLKLVVQFESESDREDFVKSIELQVRQRGGQTWSTWYPYKERNDFSNVKITE